MCVQITGKLVLCKFSADNEDKTSIFFGVSKVARGHNFVSRYPMNDWCPVQDMMRRHVPRLTSSFSLRRQNVVHFVTIKAGERCLSHRLRTSSAATYIPVRAELNCYTEDYGIFFYGGNVNECEESMFSQDPHKITTKPSV